MPYYQYVIVTTLSFIDQVTVSKNGLYYICWAFPTKPENLNKHIESHSESKNTMAKKRIRFA